jgi:uncharacterized membrane protein
MKSKRFLSIDVLRVVALLLMVQTHFVEFLSPGNAPWEALYEQSVWGVWGVTPAPLFLFVAGLSFWLWLTKQRNAGWPEGRTVRVAVRRGVGIFIIGLFFVVTIWLPEALFAWDILTLIGVALLILCALRRLPAWAFVALAGVIVLAAPPLRELTGYAAHWEEAEYLYEFTLPDVLWGFLSHAYFGLLPWLAFPLLGYAVGKHYFAPDVGKRLSGASMPVIGGLLVALAWSAKWLGDALPGYTGDMTFYPASTSYVLATMGLCLLGLWTLYRLLDARNVALRGPVVDFVRRYNRFALTTYYVHHAVHLWPIYILGLIEAQDPWWYYGDAVSTPVALALAVAFVAAFYPILIFWEKREGKYSLEWLLNRFAYGAKGREIVADTTQPHIEIAG